MMRLFAANANLLSKLVMLWRRFLRGFMRAGPMAVKAAGMCVHAAGPVALIERRRGAIGQCALTHEQPWRKNLPFFGEIGNRTVMVFKLTSFQLN